MITVWIRNVGVIFVLLTIGTGQQRSIATRNTSGAQATVHPFVHDPRIVENAPPPAPILSGTPYSEWAVNNSTYLIAYRNVDKDDPHEIIADIYLKDPQDSRLKKVLSVPVFSQVDNVKLLSMRGDSKSQLAIFRSSGQQDLLTIVSLQGSSARKLFDYGARWIKLTDDKPPKILAHSHPDDITETFVWCGSRQKIVLENECAQKR